MEMEAALPDSYSTLPVDVLISIRDNLRCLVDRRCMGQVCQSWRNALGPQQQPVQPELPWVLLPRAGGPSFSCVVRGCGGTHDFHVPEDARAARYFGTYGGGWLFLAFGQTHGHTLLNLRTNERLNLPDVVHLGEDEVDMDMSIVMLAATLSSPPEHGHSIVAAICCFAPIDHIVVGLFIRAFWHLGHPVPVRATGAISGADLEDVIHYNGAFHFLTDEEDLHLFAPVIHQDGELEIQPMGILRFQDPEGRRHYGEDAPARYLVESRGQLLMVVRLAPRAGNGIPQPTSAFRVFQLAQSPVDDEYPHPVPEYTWNELHALDDRMLFVGRGCSRSYEVANYPGFQDGVYFLDDGRFYDEEGMLTNADALLEYPCRDNGKWSAEPVIPRFEDFLPGQGPSNYSPLVWLLA